MLFTWDWLLVYSKAMGTSGSQSAIGGPYKGLVGYQFRTLHHNNKLAAIITTGAEYSKHIIGVNPIKRAQDILNSSCKIILFNPD